MSYITNNDNYLEFYVIIVMHFIPFLILNADFSKGYLLNYFYKSINHILFKLARFFTHGFSSLNGSASSSSSGFSLG